MQPVNLHISSKITCKCCFNYLNLSRSTLIIMGRMFYCLRFAFIKQQFCFKNSDTARTHSYSSFFSSSVSASPPCIILSSRLLLDMSSDSTQHNKTSHVTEAIKWHPHTVCVCVCVRVRVYNTIKEVDWRWRLQYCHAHHCRDALLILSPAAL